MQIRMDEKGRILFMATYVISDIPIFVSTQKQRPSFFIWFFYSV